MLKPLIVNAPTRTIGVFTSTRNKIQQTVNIISDDLSKIIEYNKITRPNSRFIVIDKAKSKATLYEGEKVTETFDIGVGETFGDSLNSVIYDYGAKTFSKSGRTTPSGEFRTAKLPDVCENKTDFVSNEKVNVILLNGVMHPASYCQNTSIALHQLPNDVYAQRLKVLNSQNGRKGVSTGCVNFRTTDFQRMAPMVPEQTPVYILPEEAGNSLELVELPNGRLWFKTKYKDDERANALELAIKKYFNL